MTDETEYLETDYGESLVAARPTTTHDSGFIEPDLTSPLTELETPVAAKVWNFLAPRLEVPGEGIRIRNVTQMGQMLRVLTGPMGRKLLRAPSIKDGRPQRKRLPRVTYGFAEELMLARKLLRWSRETLAAASRVSPQTILNIERGKSRGLLETRQALTAALTASGVRFEADAVSWGMDGADGEPVEEV